MTKTQGEIDTLQAAMMLVSSTGSSPRSSAGSKSRGAYGRRLADVVGWPASPRSPADRRSVFFEHTIAVRRSGELRRFLEARGAASR